MSKVQELRVLVNQRLSAAAEEIFELFERTILEYEEKLCGSKENQHKLLDAVYNPEVRLHRADIQHLLKSKEEPLHQPQKRSLSLDQENPLQIKEEQEELWSSQEEEQLGGLVEAGINTQIFTPVPLKGDEEDREEPQSAQLHQYQTEKERITEDLKTETDGEDCSGLELNRNFNPDCLFHPDFQEEALSSEFKTDDNYVWEETSETQTGATKTGHRNQIKKDKTVHRQEKPLIFSVCSERSINESSLSAHMAGHTRGRRFSCSFCKKSFSLRLDLVRHRRIHNGQKTFSCSVCGRGFSRRPNLQRHQLVHTGEKPYSCSECGKRFKQKAHLYLHRVVHTKEKAFSCLVCLKRFTQLSSLKRHKCKGVVEVN
ncbi:zinc finger protein 771-like [Xyrichtys novacula]|uniref:Zinc finger protein 771-like n=1 Tax=Xyrichtys novacula TaxID=13765 RepID=A0AAV1HBS0_XYRNO|nr:zinc finger protein 771-like [Xyrichtys novacula]